MQSITDHNAVEQFEKHQGTLRTTQALQLGIQPRTLYKLRDEGVLEQLERGLFRLAHLPPLAQPDLFIIANKIPKAVVCLISALSLHEMTDEIPHYIYLALPRNTARPQLALPIRYFSYSAETYAAGIMTRTTDGAALKLYNPAKTVADCFRFRNKIGTDVALSALKQYLQQGGSVSELAHFAAIDQVTSMMRPYVEALL